MRMTWKNDGLTPQNGGGRRFLFLMLAAVAAGTVAARTVTVASCDHETGATVLSISAAEAGDGAKALVATWSPGDIGNVATNARETAYVGAVAAADTEKSFTIPAAWRAKSGVVKFFLMTELPPYDVRLKSLRSASAGPYIDTGLVPTTNTDIRVTAYHPGDMAPFGVAGKFYLFSNNPGQDTGMWYSGFLGATASSQLTNIPNHPYEHWLNATGAYVDGYCVAAFDPASITQTTTSQLTLFARRADGSSSVAKQGDCTIYSAQLREGGVLVHDYVPCRKNGVATMYDRVQQTICAVSGSGSFVAGEEAGVAPEDCGVVESVTAAIVFAPSLSAEVSDASMGEVTVTLTGAHDEGALYAVAGTSDAGTTLGGWAETNFLCKVAADATTAMGTVPATWITGGKTMRVIWRSAADMPYDREVEWLHSAGSAWASSMVIPTRQTEISVCGRSDYDVCLFGLTTYFYLFTNGGPTYYGFFGNSGSFATYNPSTAFHTLTLGPSGASLDGVEKVHFTGESTAYTAMTKASPVFFRRDSSSGNLSKTGECWIKWAQFREAGRLVRDFVPCVSNGVACFYDRVYGTFCTSQAAATFEPGEPVANLAAADALAWSGLFRPESASAVWDNGGADNSFATAANWEGDVVPDLANGTTMLTFATAGTTAQVAAPSSVLGLKFNSANDFALTGASGASLSLAAGGITLENIAVAETWRMNDLNLPITLAADQTWDLSTQGKQRIRLNANLGGAADKTLTVTGSGSLSIYSTNDFAGTVRLDGGVTKVFSKERPFGSGANGGRIVYDQLNNGRIEMYGCTIDKPLSIAGGKRDAGSFFSRNNYGTNMISAPIAHTGQELYWRLEGGSVTELTGGGTFQRVIFDGTGTLLVGGAPISGYFFQMDNGSALHLKDTGVVAGEFLFNIFRTSTLHCWATNVTSYGCDIVLGASAVMDVHGNDQTIGDLSLTGENSRLTSDAPATVFAFYGGLRDGKGTVTNRGDIAGCVSFIKSGYHLLTFASTNTSTGVLTAQNGPLVIAPGGQWRGTEVVVGKEETNRHPSLRLMHDACFADPAHTTLAMTTSTGAMQPDMPNREPELIIDEGVCHTFKSITLNGRSLGTGTWGGPESSAQHKDATHFSGKGMVYVIGKGVTIIFR